MKKNLNKEKDKFNKKLNSNQEKDLEFKIKLKDGLQYDDENLDKDIDDLEHKISKICENKAKGAQVRSRENGWNWERKTILTL